MFKEGDTMKKRYVIKSKLRFVIFLTVTLLVLISTVTTVFGLNNANSTSFKQYDQVQIESGDTIWDIASDYTHKEQDLRKLVYEICQLNDISAEQLQTGEIILVPVHS